MATDITICSNALMLLGDDPIASLADNTKRATLCANLYPIARKEILRAHPWNCLITRVQLAPRSDTPPFGWSKWFNKPGDWIRTLGVGRDGCQDDYVSEGGRFLANTNVLSLIYTADKLEGDWDDLLVSVMTKRMELALAYPITKSTSLKDSLEGALYSRAGILAMAKRIDGQESPPEDFGDSPLISIRGGGY